MSKFPAREYADTVLSQNFEDAKRHFLVPLLDINSAHTVMLAHCGILSRPEAAAILKALDGICRNTVAAASYDDRHEDLFFYVEDLVVRACGEEVGGKMHTARSRNDIGVTMYRMVLRRRLLDAIKAVWNLRAVLIDLACAHRETIMPAHTHTQPAQPTTLAHYLAAVTEFLGRDAHRLQAAFQTVNVNPLGSCAITTTGFPINRELTGRLLGFEDVTRNSYDSIASADYLLETLSGLSTLMVGVGKFTQDLLLWSTQEFGFVRLGDAYVQISSIMPQKRNPVAIEHVRILASKAMGQCMAAQVCVHNTPFGDIVDVEDDLQPLIANAFEDALRTLRLLAAAAQSMEVDKDRLAEQAQRGFLTVTELADSLVRSEGISFKTAHRIVKESLEAIDSSPGAALAETVLPVAERLLGRKPSIDRKDIDLALDPIHFVRIRKIVGGPAPERVGEQLCQQAGEQNALREWYEAKHRLVTGYTEVLRQEADRILS